MFEGVFEGDHVTYVAVVVSVGCLLLLRAIVWLRRGERERHARLEDRRLLNPVATASPVEDPFARAKRLGQRSITDQSKLIQRVLFPVIIISTAAIAALPFLSEAPAATISLTAAGVTVLVGIAARPVVENAFAGLVISMSDLINIGDTVKLHSMYGVVEGITVTHTTIRIWDWRRYVVPNTTMLQSSVINYSIFDRHIWAYVEFWVAYDSDLEVARSIAIEAPTTSSYWAGHEDPQFWIMDMDKDAYRCWIAAWADNSADAWMLASDIKTHMILEFRKRGIRAQGFRHELAGTEQSTPQPPQA